MKKLFLFAVAVVLAFATSAQQQKAVKLNIQHQLDGMPFAYNTGAANNLSNAFKLNRLQYYMSDFVIVHDNGQTTSAGTVYALVDASLPASIDLGSFGNITTIEAIKFSIGVNTPQNNQDPAQWPASHALSPKSPSMHWGWASGYFFVALGGSSGPNLDQSLELHALGNANYYSQTIITGATGNQNELLININADYTKALKGIDISSGKILHGGTGANSTMMINFRNEVFTAVPTATISTGLITNAGVQNGFDVYPNPGSGKFTVEAKGIPAGSQFEISDAGGKVVMDFVTGTSEKFNLHLDCAGIYFIRLKGGSAVRKIVVQ